MPRRNRKVVAANRDRARKHAHRHDTPVAQDESRADRPPSWQRIEPADRYVEKRRAAY